MITFTLRMLNQILLGRLKKAPLKLKEIPNGPANNPNTKWVNKKVVEYSYRCWPVDMDIQMHMNNSSYLRVAELARWRMVYPAGVLDKLTKDGMLFLAVEQTIKYYRPIPPMAKYTMEVSCSVEDDKWIFYKQRFLSNREDANGHKLEYCVIDLKAVMKEMNGKTIRPSKMSHATDWCRELYGQDRLV